MAGPKCFEDVALKAEDHLTSCNIQNSDESAVAEEGMKMGMGSESTQRAEILDAWSQVPEDERGELVARLLDLSNSWHEWAISDNFILAWLKTKFGNAGLTWPPDRDGQVDIP